MADEARFEVSPEEAGSRLDQVVTRRLGEVSASAPTRSDVQRWIGEGRVEVNGSVVKKKKTSLRIADVVVVRPGGPLLSEATPDPSVAFDVVFEDEHLLVVNKPAGLVVHPARGHRTGTLVNGLLARPGFRVAPADPRDPEGHLRPGIVHRIDKGTSGLMVVAKTAPCREGLKAKFQAHDIERSYLAIALGLVVRMRIDTPHGRHPKSRMRFTSELRTERAADARRARTDIEPLESTSAATLIRCTLHTGRTHQIRVHMLEQAKAPLLGDPLYKHGQQSAEIAAIAERLGRQALHAAVLGFAHPITGDAMRWELPMPTDMVDAWAALQR